MKALQMVFTLLGVVAIVFGLWWIGDRLYAFLPIGVGVWWIYEVHKGGGF
jgi:hypothetical protein